MQTSRTVGVIIIVMLVFIPSCDSDGGTAPGKNLLFDPMGNDVAIPSPPLGHHGNTYRNQQYMFKVSDLSLDGWTLLVESNQDNRIQLDKWVSESSLIGCPKICFECENTTVDCLLMQPTKSNFQANKYDAYQNHMPFVHMWVEKQDGIDRAGVVDVPKFSSAAEFGVYATGEGNYCAVNWNVTRRFRPFEGSPGKKITSKDGTRGYIYDV